jgi:peptidoglycan/LPS O-acetylase OafA/YrhL
MSNNSSKSYFPALTGVRAVAAILVFLTHFGYILAAGAPLGAQRYINELSIGLPMFFVLTGFLITARYYDGFELSKRWFVKFCISRFSRLYPMYMLFTFAAFGYYLYANNTAIIAGSTNPWWVFFLNATFLRGFFDDLKFTGVGQGWSITVDVVFYLIIPFIFFAIKRYKMFFMQCVIFAVFGVFMVLLFRNRQLDGFFGNFKFLFYYSFFGRCLEIYAGMLLALNLHKINIKPNNPFKYTYLGGLMMFVAVWLFTLIPLAKGEQFGITTTPGILISDLVLVPSIFAFYLGLIKEDTWLSRFLSGKRIHLLSNASFVFYLIHLGVIHDLLHEGLNRLNDGAFALYDRLGLDWHSPFESDTINVFYILAALFAISIAVYLYIEEPVHQYVRNYLMRSLNYKKQVKGSDTVAEETIALAEN